MTRNRIFILDVAIRELSEFKRAAQRVTGLKASGNVSVNVSTLPQKAFFTMPPGGSAWHEYASNNPTLFRLFPPKALESFYPADVIAENRATLRAKANVLKELQLGSAFYTVEPHFLPEAFFEAHPKLRGPRVDHPRRSRYEEFAPCVAHPTVLQMYEQSMAELALSVPRLTNFYFRSNDTGGGICWTDWQYSGPNGPSACRDLGVLSHVRGFTEALTRGAARSGADLRLHVTGNFSDSEWRSLRSGLPPNTLAGWDRSLVVGSLWEQCYPVRGAVDPLGVLMTLQGLQRRDVENVFLTFRTPYLYDRGAENFEAMDLVIELVEDFCRKPAIGPIAVLQRLREHCDRWAKGDAQALFDALYQLHEAVEHFRSAIPRQFYLAVHGPVSMRYATRPLLAVPESLTPEEEAYFLPHIFNVSADDARSDYNDAHGASWTGQLPSGAADPRLAALKVARERLDQACNALDPLGPARDGYFGRLARGLRIYSSFMRSAGNFFAAQVIRDRNPAILYRQPQPRPKRLSWTGDVDLLLLNEIQRDEFNNTEELIDLLDAGGLELIWRAQRPEDEDTFLLGPALMDQLHTKRRLMRKHWLDAQSILPPPLK